VAYRFLICGKVQGVGFRKFIKNSADKFGLNGWTRNLLDGRVEAVMDCDEQTLDSVCAILKKGPDKAVVEKMLVENANYQIDNVGFEIRQ
jgi:acylphosphatase